MTPITFEQGRQPNGAPMTWKQDPTLHFLTVFVGATPTFFLWRTVDADLVCQQAYDARLLRTRAERAEAAIALRANPDDTGAADLLLAAVKSECAAKQRAIDALAAIGGGS